MFAKLIPKLTIASIYEIDIQQLWTDGIRGIITDLDNTLVGSRVAYASPEVEQWIRRAESIGFKVVIVSNNRNSRVSRFAEPLNVPFIYSAGKPTLGAFYKAMDKIGTTVNQTAMIGDQLFTDVLGGNRLGLYTILVNPVTPKEEAFPTKINRQLEKIVKRFMK